MRLAVPRMGIACSILGAAFAASPLTATSAQAAASYVVDNTSPACSDVGPGSASQPFCTIGAAAKQAQAGDTVLVNAGTYPGTSVNPANSGTTSTPITFTANAGVTISGGTGGFALSGRSNVVINGFIITGTSSNGISVSGGSNVVISQNTVSQAGQPVGPPAQRRVPGYRHGRPERSGRPARGRTRQSAGKPGHGRLRV